MVLICYNITFMQCIGLPQGREVEAVEIMDNEIANDSQLL